MEGNCVWPRERQISDRELNKSAQVRSERPAQGLCMPRISMLGDSSLHSNGMDREEQAGHL